MSPLPAILAVAALIATAILPPAAAATSVEVDGTEFKVTADDGTVLRSPDLVGAVLTIATSGGPLRVRIGAVERDPDARGGPVWLHSFSTPATDGIWQNLCEAGPDGRRQGFPLAFRPRQPDGLMGAAPPGIFELTCTGGARGKCVRFGYRPWGDGAIERYNACVRMVRADYCGAGEGTTRNGMRPAPSASATSGSRRIPHSTRWPNPARGCASISAAIAPRRAPALAVRSYSTARRRSPQGAPQHPRKPAKGRSAERPFVVWQCLIDGKTGRYARYQKPAQRHRGDTQSG